MLIRLVLIAAKMCNAILPSMVLGGCAGERGLEETKHHEKVGFV